MTHADYLELLAGAAIGDLDASERTTLREHTATCAICAQEAPRLDDTLVDLALAVPQRRPSAALEARIMAAVAGEPRVASTPAPAPAPGARSTAAPGGVGAGSGPVSATGRGARWFDWLRRPGFAVAALGLALILGVSSLVLGLQSADLRSTIATQNAAIAVLAAPDHVQVPLTPEDGNPATVAMAVFIPHTSSSYVMATGLHPTPTGQVYQLWYADSSGVHALGTYRYDGTGPFVAPFGVDLAGSAAAMVTLEPAGGATGDTPGPQVVFGELPSS